MMDQQYYPPTMSDRGNRQVLPMNQGLPFWAQVLLLVVLIASFCLNLAQAYHRHLFEQGWEDCPSRLVYQGTCVPGPESMEQDGAST